jgi:hypothetical protein
MQHLTRSQRQMALALQQGGVHRVYVPPPPRHPGRALKRIVEGIVFVAGAVGLLALLALVAGYGGA